jgi:hypothetical protein
LAEKVVGKPGGEKEFKPLRIVSLADARSERDAAIASERGTESERSARELDGAVLCLVRARAFDTIKDVLRTASHDVVNNTLLQLKGMCRFDVVAEIAEMDGAPGASKAARSMLGGLGVKDVSDIGWKNSEYCGGSPVRVKAVQASLEAVGIYGNAEAGKAAFDAALSAFRKTDDAGYLLSAVNIVTFGVNGETQRHGADRLLELGNEVAIREVERAGMPISVYMKRRHAEV